MSQIKKERKTEANSVEIYESNHAKHSDQRGTAGVNVGASIGYLTAQCALSCRSRVVLVAIVTL